MRRVRQHIQFDLVFWWSSLVFGGGDELLGLRADLAIAQEQSEASRRSSIRLCFAKQVTQVSVIKAKPLREGSSRSR